MKFEEQRPSSARVFEARDRVRWSDVDIAGIIYFGAYVRFIELAETELFRELGFPYAEMFERLKIWLPRVHLDFDFYAPALMDDELVARTHVVKLGNSSITFRVIMQNAATAVVDAAATLVVAAVDRDQMKSRPLPPELRSALKSCLPPTSSE
ncbi:MAG: hypothetical protein DLM50_02265 [Candidatus Meridianibacter frigidus]|nr:MAG: hypothetical protein DLM50_02265 [Candidatus Eremiobacteraeota bacterium]